MPINAGDILQVSVFGRCYGQRIMLTRNYQCSTASTGADTRTQLLAIGAAVKASGAFGVAYLDCMTTQYIADVIRCQVVYPTRSTFADTQWSENGTYDANESLVQSTGCITLQTAKAGRSQRATVHIGPLPVEAVQSGSLTAGYMTLLNTLGARFLANLTTLGPGAVVVSPIVYHRNADGAINKSDPVTAYSAHDELRTMRRRVVGRGI